MTQPPPPPSLPGMPEGLPQLPAFRYFIDTNPMTVEFKIRWRVSASGEVDACDANRGWQHAPEITADQFADDPHAVETDEHGAPLVPAPPEGVADAHESKLIDQRDQAEDAITEAYSAVLGRSPEWSNLFGYGEAVADIEAATAAKDAEIAGLRAELADADAGNDRLHGLIDQLAKDCRQHSAELTAARAALQELSEKLGGLDRYDPDVEEYQFEPCGTMVKAEDGEWLDRDEVIHFAKEAAALAQAEPATGAADWHFAAADEVYRFCHPPNRCDGGSYQLETTERLAGIIRKHVP